MKSEPTLQVSDALTAWQRLRPEALPGVFYVYDKAERHSERVVTYELTGGGRKQLLNKYDRHRKRKPEADLFLTIHLGINPDFLTEEIPDTPAFTLFAQIRWSGMKANNLRGCRELTWEANGRFSTINPEEVTNETNSIPAASAFLFVRSWQEIPEERLAEPFTAKTRVLGERVKSYTFSAPETATIMEDVRSSLSDKEGGLAVHLGDGIAIWSHPFSFRPVVEVRKGIANPDEPLTNGRRVTGLDDGQGDSFFDFSRPDPPPQPNTEG